MTETTDFFAHFSVLPDPRVERTKKHLLIDILFIAVCTIIGGGEGFTEMEDLGQAREKWLRKFLDLPHGIPSHDTFRRVFSLLDPQAFGGVLSVLDGGSARRHQGTDHRPGWQDPPPQFRCRQRASGAASDQRLGEREWDHVGITESGWQVQPDHRLARPVEALGREGAIQGDERSVRGHISWGE